MIRMIIKDDEEMFRMLIKGDAYSTVEQNLFAE
jgi:hypothetical protein